MDDFRNFAKGNQNSHNDENKRKTDTGTGGVNGNLLNLVQSIASKFDGKNQNELIKSVYEQAKQGKENGTLTNRDIDNFVAMLAPLLDDRKRKILFKITNDLKKL